MTRTPEDMQAPDVTVERRPDGTMIYRSSVAPAPFSRCSGEWLVHWAEKSPDGVFLARKVEGRWNELTYSDALARVRSLAQALLDRNLGPDRPLMILSGNGIDFALLSLAAMHVGIPVAPVSPAYSLASGDFARLDYVRDLVTPGMIYAGNPTVFGPALDRLRADDVELAAGADGADLTSLDALLQTRPTGAVDAAFDAVGPDTIAKFLFTSGSTGSPKGVITTQRMLCSNQEAVRRLWPFLEEEPPVLVDWLPWHHTFGGSYCFNLVLRNGGTLFIDDGKPAPGLLDITIGNLREISPTIYFNVPAGYQALLPHLQDDEELRESFFRRLRVVFYAAAALPGNVWDALARLAEKSPVPARLGSGWGATETAPLITQIQGAAGHAGAIGTPVPGVTMKLVPVGGKLEARIKGDNITPGYWRQPELTAKAFDDEGFYCIGDAVRFADDNDPSQGLVFDGRISEDFKLTTGTWVNAGVLRPRLVEACAPLLQDAVVAGLNRDEIGILAILANAACARIGALAADTPTAELASNDAVRKALRERVAAYNDAHPATSRRVARLLILEEPLSIDAGETTDKGYINQRGVLESRKELVDRLYTDHESVMRFPK